MSNVDQLETELSKLTTRLDTLEEQLKSLQHYKEDYSPLCNRPKLLCALYEPLTTPCHLCIKMR